MSYQIAGRWINEVIQLARSKSSDGDVQLSILARALVIGCKSCKVDRGVALSMIDQLYDEPVDLIPLEEPRPEPERDWRAGRTISGSEM